MCRKRAKKLRAKRQTTSYFFFRSVALSKGLIHRVTACFRLLTIWHFEKKIESSRNTNGRHFLGLAFLPDVATAHLPNGSSRLVSVRRHPCMDVITAQLTFQHTPESLKMEESSAFKNPLRLANISFDLFEFSQLYWREEEKEKSFFR